MQLRTTIRQQAREAWTSLSRAGRTAAAALVGCWLGTVLAGSGWAQGASDPSVKQVAEEEHARLQEMLDSPDAFRKHVQKDLTGKKLAVDLIKLLPDAMIFSYTPGQPQREDKSASAQEELVIDFKPNPKWNPPTMVSQALAGLEGRCWVDRRTHHLTRLEADLFQGVNFGFGIFAHLYPGGTFVLEQVQVGDGRWIVDHFTEHVTVRAMMVKTIKENTDLAAGEFAAVPAMGYQEAIKELLEAK
jgi:hypothetical protein